MPLMHTLLRSAPSARRRVPAVVRTSRPRSHPDLTRGAKWKSREPTFRGAVRTSSLLRFRAITHLFNLCARPAVHLHLMRIVCECARARCEYRYRIDVSRSALWAATPSTTNACMFSTCMRKCGLFTDRVRQKKPFRACSTKIQSAFTLEKLKSV